MRNVQTAILSGFVLLLAACAGLAQPKSFDQQLAYAYGQVTTVRQATANALNSKVIKVADAEQVLKLTDDARAALDLSRLDFAAGDASTALGKLQMANNILLQLAQYLQARGVK